jgi:signal transduction histidine kinase
LTPVTRSSQRHRTRAGSPTRRPSTEQTARLTALADYRLVDPDGTSLIAKDAPAGTQLWSLTELAGRLCGVHMAAINIVDDRHQTQIAVSGADPVVCAVEDSICPGVLPMDEPLVVPDAREDSRLRNHPAVDGRVSAIRFYASVPLRTPGGHVIGTLSVADPEPSDLDATARADLPFIADQIIGSLELRRRTLQLMVAVDELSRSNEVLGEFVGRASHDLRTPLTAIAGFAELLRSLPIVRGDARAMEFAGHVVSSSKRMRELIDDLLAYASVGGQLTLSAVPVDEVVADVLHDLSNQPAVEQARVSVDSAVVRADRVQVRALLQNLIANAVQHGALANGPDIEILATVRPGGGWTLRVVDHGVGIPADEREHVLEPFVRLHAKTDLGGTGLGLATCVQIAHAHGGTLEVGETPGGGTTVTIDVPAATR